MYTMMHICIGLRDTKNARVCMCVSVCVCVCVYVCVHLQIRLFKRQTQFQKGPLKLDFLTMGISMEEIVSEVISEETQPPGQRGVPGKVNKVEPLIGPDVEAELDSTDEDP